MKASKSFLLFISLLMAIPCIGNPTFRIFDGISNTALKETMEQNVNNIITLFNTSAGNRKKSLDLKGVNYVTPEVKETLQKMWESSMMMFPDGDIKSSCLHVPTGGYQVRGIPLIVLSADEEEKNQELTFDFTDSGQICHVAIAIDSHRYEAIMKKNVSDIDYARKQAVVNFIEDFRTAYNKKDLEFIENVFSSNALIITGRIVKRAVPSDLARNKMKEYVDVEYDVYNKQQYIEKLRKIFKRTRFINVRFEDVNVVKLPQKEDVYGVYLKQDWKTDKYQDEGLLFLKVDFSDKDFPMIQVRVWKPYRDKDGNIITSDPKGDFVKFLMDPEI